MSECVVRSRVDSRIKDKASKMFEHMGLTLSEAIRLFLYQSVAEKRIPFPIRIPNTTTRKAIDDVEQKEGLEEVTLAQLVDDWGK